MNVIIKRSNVQTFKRSNVNTLIGAEPGMRLEVFLFFTHIEPADGAHVSAVTSRKLAVEFLLTLRASATIVFTFAGQL